MKQPAINLAKLLKKYPSGWVAISTDFKRVVHSGKTLKETMQKAKGIKERLYYFPTRESYSHFVG